jgi:hypothetical protein
MGAPATQAQSFRVGDHVEALPYGTNWYPCVVTRGAPNYGVKCTNIDGTSSDFSVMATRLRADSGQAAAAMADRWAKRFMPGSHVEAAPYGEQNGYHSCTVLSVTGNGAMVGIYHLKCDMGYETGPAAVDVGAIDYIRAATHGEASAPAKGGPAAGAGQVQPSALGAGGAVAQGTYECWSSGQANFMLNFSVTGAHQYSGANGRGGSFAFDASSQRITFKDGSLAGAMPEGFYSIYYAPQGRPTVSFRNASGNEAAFCQKK